MYHYILDETTFTGSVPLKQKNSPQNPKISNVTLILTSGGIKGILLLISNIVYGLHSPNNQSS